ncbi:uncharacterized protein LOC6596012 [Drosophila persimilis]|nr:uncharacterized protein LOC6596012 [Drosophila persimilis]
MMRRSVCAWVVLAALLAAVGGEAYNDVAINADMSIGMGQCPPYDDPGRVVLLPFHNDCSKYITCLQGNPYVQQCPDNLFWSQRNYRCVNREYSECRSTDTEDFVEYSAYPGDCSRFYEKRALRCANNYLFNPQNQRCEPYQYVSCKSVPPWNSVPPTDPNYPMIPSTVPPAATPPSMIWPTPAPDNNAPLDAQSLCKNSIPNSYIPFPGDCHKFIHCGPTATVLNCPADLFWNTGVLSCTASSSGCQLLH